MLGLALTCTCSILERRRNESKYVNGAPRWYDDDEAALLSMLLAVPTGRIVVNCRTMGMLR